MKKKAKFILSSLCVLLLLMFIQIPNTVNASTGLEFNEFNFPDNNFRRAIKESFPEYTKDDFLTTEEISNIYSLDVSEEGIKNLKGIEYFINLKYLNISVNNIEELDLSKNENLKSLEASNNQLLKK